MRFDEIGKTRSEAIGMLSSFWIVLAATWLVFDGGWPALSMMIVGLMIFFVTLRRFLTICLRRYGWLFSTYATFMHLLVGVVTSLGALSGLFRYLLTPRAKKERASPDQERL